MHSVHAYIHFTVTTGISVAYRRALWAAAYQILMNDIWGVTQCVVFAMYNISCLSKKRMYMKSIKILLSFFFTGTLYLAHSRVGGGICENVRTLRIVFSAEFWKTLMPHFDS